MTSALASPLAQVYIAHPGLAEGILQLNYNYIYCASCKDFNSSSLLVAGGDTIFKSSLTGQEVMIIGGEQSSNCKSKSNLFADVMLMNNMTYSKVL